MNAGNFDGNPLTFIVGLLIGAAVGFLIAALFASSMYNDAFAAGHLRGTRDARARR